MQKPEANVDSISKGVQTVGAALVVAALFAHTGSASAILDFLNQTLVDAGDLGTITNGMAIASAGFVVWVATNFNKVRRAKPALVAVPILSYVGISTVFLSSTVTNAVTSDPVMGFAVFAGSSAAFLGTVHRSTLEKLNDGVNNVR